jgi:hypothetical protein
MLDKTSNIEPDDFIVICPYFISKQTNCTMPMATQKKNESV